MFLNPLMLAGVGAVTLPIVIHLLNRRQHRRIKWAAMRFLAVTVEKTRRQLNIEDLILLILRCLAIALLAFVFARPALSGSGAGGWFGQAPITGVILLDHSMSMAHSDGTATRFDRAKEAALKLLDSAPSGSNFALLLFGDDIDAAIPQPTLDLNLVRQTIKKAQVTDTGTQVRFALRTATDLLQSKAAARREIHIFTDGQATGLAPLKLLQEAAQTAETGGIHTSMVVVSDNDNDNIGITDLRLDGGLFITHHPARFLAEISNYSAKAVQNVHISLKLGNAPPSDEQTVASLAPGEHQRVMLTASPTDAGYQAVTVSIPSDHLSADDTRSIALRAAESVSVLLVDAAGSSSRPDSGAFFLRNAFAPVAREQRADYFVHTTTISPTDLGSTHLEEYQTIVLCDVPDFAPADSEKLGAFVRRGGGLIIFPGPTANLASYNKNLAKAGLIPASLGDGLGNADNREKPMTLQADGFEHEIAQIWNDPNSGSPASVRVLRALELIPDTTTRTDDIGPARVVLRFATASVNGTLAGKPMLMERSVGSGRVLLFATTADTRWTDLPVRPAVLVPLLQRTLALTIASNDDAMNVRAGRPFLKGTGAELLGRDATILRPAPQSTAPAEQAPGDVVAVQVRDARPSLSYSQTAHSGVYDVTFKGEPPLKWAFAVQSDPAESNLATCSDAELHSLEPAIHVVSWNPSSEKSDSLPTSGPIEFWGLAALTALALFAVEVLLGNWFSRPR